MLIASEDIIDRLPDCNEVEITVRTESGKVVARATYLSDQISTHVDAIARIEYEAGQAGYDPDSIEFDSL